MSEYSEVSADPRKYPKPGSKAEARLNELVQEAVAIVTEKARLARINLEAFDKQAVEIKIKAAVKVASDAKQEECAALAESMWDRMGTGIARAIRNIGAL